MFLALKKFFTQFVKACTDFTFYKNVYDNTLSTSFKFFFKLILFISIIVGIHQGIYLSNQVKLVLNWAKRNMPNLVIKEGKLNTEVEQPYDTNFKKIPVIVDTTGKVKNLNNYNKGVLLKKKEILYKRKGVKSVSISLENIKDMNFNSSFITQLEKNLYPKLVPLIVLFIYIYFSLIKATHILLFSILGLGVSNFRSKGFSYNEILNIAIYAFAPLGILTVVFGVVGLRNNFSWIIYTGVYAFYIVGSIFYTDKQEVEIIKQNNLF